MRVIRRLAWIGTVAAFVLFAACVSEAEQEEPAVQQVEPTERSSTSALQGSSLTPPPGDVWYEGSRPSPNCFWTCLNGTHGERTIVGAVNCQRACERACGHTCLLR